MIATLDAEADAVRAVDADLPDGFDDMAHICKMLSDPGRLRIVFFLLQHSELNVGDICSRLRQSQPAVSHHLALLKRAGLLRVRRDGKHNFYSLAQDELANMLVQLCDVIADTSNGTIRLGEIIASRPHGTAEPVPQPSDIASLTA